MSELHPEEAAYWQRFNEAHRARKAQEAAEKRAAEVRAGPAGALIRQLEAKATEHRAAQRVLMVNAAAEGRTLGTTEGSLFDAEQESLDKIEAQIAEIERRHRS